MIATTMMKVHCMRANIAHPAGAVEQARRSASRAAVRDSRGEPLSRAPETRNNRRITTIHREVTMQPGHRWLGVAAGLLAAGLISGSVCGDAQAQAALAGVVSSSDEGAMEGVLVSARKDGSSITTTVVSDQHGAYSFPSARLEPGEYTISIRAIGYRLDGAKTVDVATGGEGRADLKLSKVKSLVPQLSSGEWLLSLPRADKQKAFLTMRSEEHMSEIP